MKSLQERLSITKEKAQISIGVTAGAAALLLTGCSVQSEHVAAKDEATYSIDHAIGVINEGGNPTDVAYTLANELNHGKPLTDEQDSQIRSGSIGASEDLRLRLQHIVQPNDHVRVDLGEYNGAPDENGKRGTDFKITIGVGDTNLD